MLWADALSISAPLILFETISAGSSGNADATLVIESSILVTLAFTVFENAIFAFFTRRFVEIFREFVGNTLDPIKLETFVAVTLRSLNFVWSAYVLYACETIEDGCWGRALTAIIDQLSANASVPVSIRLLINALVERRVVLLVRLSFCLMAFTIPAV